MESQNILRPLYVSDEFNIEFCVNISFYIFSHSLLFSVTPLSLSLLVPPLPLSLSLLLAKCIDHYTQLRVVNYDTPDGPQKEVDPRLESVVNRMFDKCFGEGHYHQAAGIAFETRRIDILEKAIMEAVSDRN